MPSIEISRRFRDYREAEALTQKELAALLGCESNYIYKVEAGLRSPSKSIVKLFETLEKAGHRMASTVSAKEPQSMSPPPHAPLERTLEDAAFHKPPLVPQEGDYGTTVSMLRKLFERNPEAFRSAAAMIKGLHEIQKP
jgi:transcriptional regulator with XRE-family HTH domain